MRKMIAGETATSPAPGSEVESAVKGRPKGKGKGKQKARRESGSDQEQERGKGSPPAKRATSPDPSPSPRKRKRFSKEEEGVVRNYFNKHISTRSFPTVTAVAKNLRAYYTKRLPITAFR